MWPTFIFTLLYVTYIPQNLTFPCFTRTLWDSLIDLLPWVHPNPLTFININTYIPQKVKAFSLFFNIIIHHRHNYNLTLKRTLLGLTWRRMTASPLT